jgi:hypothetical protein
MKKQNVDQVEEKVENSLHGNYPWDFKKKPIVLMTTLILFYLMGGVSQP